MVGTGAHAAANAEVLVAVQALRADVHAALETDVHDEAATPLRTALGKHLAPVCTLLASPATPLPEEMRARATNMLKQMLRREMIDDAPMD